MLTAAIITLSDKSAQGVRKDESGPALEKLVTQAGYQVTKTLLLCDDCRQLEQALCRLADEGAADLILTTGGTGFSPRDNAPEATMAAMERPVPGIPECMRSHCLHFTKRAMLSRGVCGIRKKSLILNLPGSPTAAVESLTFVLPQLEHGLNILTGRETDCARQE